MARYEIQGSKISQLPKKEQLDGSEAFIIEDAEGTKQAGAAALKNYIGSGGGTVDQELDAESTNAVANKAVTEELSKLTTEYNVSVFYPDGGTDGTNKYTLETAIGKVPESVRNVGLKCSFLDDGGKVQTWEYLGGAWAAGSFSQVGVAKFSELEGEIYNNFPISKKYYDPVNGAETVVSSRDYVITGKVYIKGSEKIVIRNAVSNMYISSVVFFDKDGEYISSTVGDTDASNNYSVTIDSADYPENAEYVGATSNASIKGKVLKVIYPPLNGGQKK